MHETGGILKILLRKTFQGWINMTVEVDRQLDRYIGILVETDRQVEKVCARKKAQTLIKRQNCQTNNPFNRGRIVRQTIPLPEVELLDKQSL